MRAWLTPYAPAHVRCPGRYLKGADEEKALNAGAKRLRDEALSLRGSAQAEAFSRAARAYLLLAARLLQAGWLQGTDNEAKRDKCLLRAANVWYAAAGRRAATSSSGQAARQDAARLYAQAGAVLRDGLLRNSDALACCVRAAEQDPKDAARWRDALRAYGVVYGTRKTASQDALRFLATNETASDEERFEKIEALVDEFASTEIEFGDGQ